jgi:hypothetical protein
MQEKVTSEYTISLIEASHDPLFAVVPKENNGCK